MIIKTERSGVTLRANSWYGIMGGSERRDSSKMLTKTKVLSIKILYYSSSYTLLSESVLYS